MAVAVRHGVTIRGAVIARTRVVAKPDGNHRLRLDVHDTRRRRHVNDAWSLLDIHDLRLRLDDLRRRIDRGRVRDGGSIGNGRRLDDDLTRLPIHHLPGLTVHLLPLVVYHRRRRRLIDGLLGPDDVADNSTGRGAEDNAFSPMIAVVPADQTAGNGTNYRARPSSGRTVHLRLRRPSRTGGDCERNCDEKCFHFDDKTPAAGLVFIRFCKKRHSNELKKSGNR
jgi:hypothetical protein